ncbi:MAG: zinc ABC transporter substrate-binding protein [Pedosphaera sp.]|nr:zinc ABC transporter substrate-binding protein [Pedosphaera sp.]
MNTPRLQLLLIAMLAVALGCSPATPQKVAPNTATGSLRIVAANYPLQYFARRIAGDLAVVTQPAPAGEDPSDWQPATNQLRAFIRDCQAADLILLNTPGYSRWVDWGSLAERQCVHTTASFADHLVPVEEQFRQGAHQHGTGRQHSHATLAVTVWLDPQLAIRQAAAIGAALSRLRPAQAQTFAANLRVLESDLQSLHREWTQLLDGREAMPLLASHPVYQYFQKRYRLNLQSVHWEPDEMPDEKEWAAFAVLLAKHPARWMLWEDAPLPAIAARLRGLGVTPVVLAPGFAAPDSGDYLDLMRRNTAELRRALDGR